MRRIGLNRAARLLLLLLLGGGVPLGCREEPVRVPVDLIGVYTANDERYASCTLQISADRMVWTDREGNVHTQAIVAVDAPAPGSSDPWTLRHSLSDGGVGSFSFQRSGDRLRPVGQPGLVWARRGRS